MAGPRICVGRTRDSAPQLPADLGEGSERSRPQFLIFKVGVICIPFPPNRFLPWGLPVFEISSLDPLDTSVSPEGCPLTASHQPTQPPSSPLHPPPPYWPGSSQVSLSPAPACPVRSLCTAQVSLSTTSPIISLPACTHPPKTACPFPLGMQALPGRTLAFISSIFGC